MEAVIDDESLTVRNLAMDIFSCSLDPLTSASAVSLMAGGPVGMSMRQNHSIGSLPRTDVLEASAQMTGILILRCGRSSISSMSRRWAPHDPFSYWIGRGGCVFDDEKILTMATSQI